MGNRSVLVASIRDALGESDSYLLKSYAVIGTLVALFVLLLLFLALQGWLFAVEASVIERAGIVFLGLVVLLFVAGMFAPMVFFRRRQTTGRPTRGALFGLSGYLFLLSLYLGLAVTMPEEQQETPSGLLGPIVEVVYALPRFSGVLFPIIGLAGIAAVEYGLDRSDDGESPPGTGTTAESDGDQQQTTADESRGESSADPADPGSEPR